MNVLVLGGTIFVGRHIVHALQKSGHRVSIFTRGRTNADVHSDIEAIVGDRDSDTAALDGRDFDVVIDTSAYHPRRVRRSADALGTIGHYVFVSTVSVYAESPGAFVTETSETLAPILDEAERVNPSTYGGLKRACEDVVREKYGDRATIVRPGLLIGPNDPSNRFDYWVRRAAEGGEMLAPGNPSARIQLLDARDLAAWLAGIAKHSGDGIFNVVGPESPLTMGEMLATCVATANAGTSLNWMADDFLVANGVTPWTELPFWVPSSDSIVLADATRARETGLTFRPLAATIADILAALPTEPPGRISTVNRTREKDLLAAWRGKAGTAL